MKSKRMDHIDWSEHFYYDETSLSCLRWNREVLAGKNYARVMYSLGDPAGSLTQKKTGKYWIIQCQGFLYQASRIVMRLHGKTIDDLVVDHEDGDSTLNKINNLRAVSQMINNRNKSPKNSHYGIFGVSFNVRNNNEYFRAFWKLEKGGSKNFSINKLGIMEAFKQAIVARTDAIKRLNSEGMGYTERHATNLT